MTGTSVDSAVRRLADGGIVVVVDDENRENEGDLIMAAEHATPEKVAFFLEYTSGFLCVAITAARARELDLELMVRHNTESHGTAFLVSVDYRHGTSTGISAGDRAATVAALAAETTTAADLARPGHILPLLAREPGVLVRAGHTEAGVDLCRLAGVRPAALLCELVTPDRLGMMRGPAIEEFAARHGLPLVTIAELVGRLRAAGGPVERAGAADIPTPLGDFRAIAYRSTVDGIEHLALVLGDVGDGTEVLVRVHSECLTGDVIGSLRCDCGGQFDLAMRRIAEAGRGVLVYLRGHEGRGIGLAHKLRAYQLQQDERLDTVDANLRLGLPVDGREYGTAAHILRDLGVSRIQLMTNNPEKYHGLLAAGLDMAGTIGLETQATAHNITYLSAKRDRLGHRLDIPPHEHRIAR
ncbi:MAG TPA: bifunctional 3,4-dihydroxy-2-butanone-4-phosphate synthase/GTP cyclohydrolase II [Actinophytocola sp.]|uniref:bifunctional 3,4-dihydroxy-2-butanone-4-phosphate synthase/GTP cyclohydrolase II n=1 Tax=Actinophytocola sp. TaxID=1872138 RepID=UPI002DB7C91C|nr:bifunctional 3,4-dihydroxy-2-butanone-4-phosphate synthase/GTP cyclohydrolase II [Actinophytocola sp.]HEU5475581.1 bifunctional 3,4-dihydroxy-2-butanone-4-phosphate synthase/GTP cyclohydrolase II [Actinophytocola sp.]